MVASLAGQSVPVLAEDRLRLPAGLPPALEVRLADVDLDGRLDLLRLGSDTLDVLLQTPSGEFEPHPAQGRATFPGADFRSLAVGHLGLGGAAPDLVLARAALPPLVLGNDGSGRFTVGGILLPLPPAPVASVLVGDLDGVPPDDLLVLPEQGRPQLLLGQNVIGYRDASQLLPANLFVQAPLGALADLDGDGDLDVVVASRAGAAPFVLDNNAGFQRQVALPFVGACAALAVADFDGDRRLDVALARVQPAPGNVEFVRNRATGFAAYVPAVAFPLDASVARLVAADLSRAGTTDLVLL